MSILVRAFVLTILFAPMVVVGESTELRLWRGETRAERLADGVVVDLAPAGIGIRFGELKRVKAAPTPKSTERVEVLDRVEWCDTPRSNRVIEVSVPADAKPGVYRCGNLAIKVVDRVLPPPVAWTYYLDLWQHPWAVARFAKVEPFSPAHYRAMRPLWKLLAEAGQKTLTVTLVDQPWNHQCYDAYGSMIFRTRRADGSWCFDYSIFDAYVEFGRSCGLGPNISCYTLCPWGCICRYQKEGVGEVSVKAEPGTPEFDDFWGEFLTDFAKHLKEKGWFKDVLIAMDERTPKDVQAVVDFVHRKAPGLRISMAGNRNPKDFTGITIDSYAQLLLSSCLTPEFLAEVKMRRQKGLTTTHYVCCSPRHPNTFLVSGAGEPFWCGVYPAMAGLDGFLRWAYNSWPQDPMKDGTFGAWMAGDTFLVYPNGNPSWRFLELRQGIVTAEKIRLLRKQGLFENELNALAQRYLVQEANEGKTDFRRLKSDTMALVNRD